MRHVVFALSCCGCQLVFPLAPTEVADANDPADTLDGPLRANRVFVTSSTHTGNLGGLAGADAICAARAAEAELAGTFVAWLSGTGIDAIDRLAGSRGWVRVDDEPVADLPTDLAVGGPLSPIALTEAGDDVRMLPGNVWTGTDADGSRAPMSRRCLEWTSASSDLGRSGGSAHGGTAFTILLEFEQCFRENRLYCFEVGNDVALDLVPITPNGPIAFVSNTAWNGIDVGAADAICAADAAAANLAGTFLAALAQDGMALASRFSSTDRVYVRVDGRPVGRILADPLSTRPVLLTATGTANTTRVFTGAGLTTLGTATSTCDNWSNLNGTATVGNSAASDARMFRDEADIACTVARPVYCLQVD